MPFTSTASTFVAAVQSQIPATNDDLRSPRVRPHDHNQIKTPLTSTVHYETSHPISAFVHHQSISTRGAPITSDVGYANPPARPIHALSLTKQPVGTRAVDNNYRRTTFDHASNSPSSALSFLQGQLSPVSFAH
jgi:hypothetical protein